MSAPASCAPISGSAPATTTLSANWPRRSTRFRREASLDDASRHPRCPALRLRRRLLRLCRRRRRGGQASGRDRQAERLRPRHQGAGRRCDQAQERPGDAQGDREQICRAEEKGHDAPAPGAGGLPRPQPRTFYIISGALAATIGALCLLFHQSLLITVLVAFAVGLGLPRWVLGFLKNRREKAFTNEFANAIDVIVRSVKSGLPTNKALHIDAHEVPAPCGSEFNRLCEGLKVGVTLEQGVKKMYESMPTAEVAFFGIVMTIQQKSGGNLSEALGNLSTVLRDRKRLQGKIKAMSSEAKASAGIIGSLPPGVMGIVWLTP